MKIKLKKLLRKALPVVAGALALAGKRKASAAVERVDEALNPTNDPSRG